MATLTITDANVAWTANSAAATTFKGVAGETLTRGIPVYQAAADKRYYKCDANTTIDAANCVGVTFSGGAAGDYIEIVADGSIMDIGATTAIGVTYFVSATVGLFDNTVPASGSYNTAVLVGRSTAGEVQVKIIVSGQQVA